MKCIALKEILFWSKAHLNMFQSTCSGSAKPALILDNRNIYVYFRRNMMIILYAK